MAQDPHQEMEPGQLIAAESRRWALKALRGLGDLVHGWTGAKVLAWFAAAAAVIWAGVASNLEIGFVIGVTILLVIAGVYMVGARRLLHGERARRRWAQVSALRADERRIRAEQRMVVAVLALSGQRQPGHLDPDFREALVAARGAGMAGQDVREAARKARIDKMLARRSELETEARAVEASIQSLASPGDTAAAEVARETAEQAARARANARAADRAARDRRRRGQKATTASGSEIPVSFAIGPDGVRAVSVGERQATPEQIAAGTLGNPGSEETRGRDEPDPRGPLRRRI